MCTLGVLFSCFSLVSPRDKLNFWRDEGGAHVKLCLDLERKGIEIDSHTQKILKA